MSSPLKPVCNFSLPSYSAFFTTAIGNTQPQLYLRRSHLPPLLVATKSLLRLRPVHSLPKLQPSLEPKPKHHPHPLRSNPPSQPFARPPPPQLTSLPVSDSVIAFPKSSKSWFDDTSDLVLARRALLEERSGDFRSTAIRNRMDESSGKLFPALRKSPPTKTTDFMELGPVYFLRSLSRNDQRARVGDPDRNVHLLPSKPADLLRKKLREQVIERRRLQRQEAETGRPRRALNTLRVLMLKGNKQAEAEYFQRREEEEQAKKQANKKSDE